MTPLDTFLFGVVLAAGGAVAGAFLMWLYDTRKDKAWCRQRGISYSDFRKWSKEGGE